MTRPSGCDLGLQRPGGLADHMVGYLCRAASHIKGDNHSFGEVRTYDTPGLVVTIDPAQNAQVASNGIDISQGKTGKQSFTLNP